MAECCKSTGHVISTAICVRHMVYRAHKIYCETLLWYAQHYDQEVHVQLRTCYTYQIQSDMSYL